jgi:hypothetical protein
METNVNERIKKQTGRHANSFTSLKKARKRTDKTSRQQVLRMEFVAKVRTYKTVQLAGTEGGGTVGTGRYRQVRRQKLLNGQKGKQAGMQTYCRNHTIKLTSFEKSSAKWKD